MGVKIDDEVRQENGIKNKINKGRAVRSMLNGVLWNRQVTRKNKLQIYNSVVKSTVTYGAETWKFNKNLESKLMSMEMEFFKEIGEMFKFRKKNRKNVIREKYNIKNSVLDCIRYKQLN